MVTDCKVCTDGPCTECKASAEYLIKDATECSPDLPDCNDVIDLSTAGSVDRTGCVTCVDLYVTVIECTTCIEGHYLGPTGMNLPPDGPMSCIPCGVVGCLVCPADTCE